MNFFIGILVICFLVFLYNIFIFSKDDFVLLRKNITLEQLFNISFIGFGLSILAARIFFVIEHWNKDYLNLLVFILFPYFPGLSFTGGILIGGLYLWNIARKKKYPLSRLVDIFSLAFIFSLSTGYFLVSIVEIIRKKIFFLDPIYFLLCISLSIFSYFLFIKNKVKDGKIALIILAVMSLSFIPYLFLSNKNHFYYLLEIIIFALFFIFSCVMFVIGRKK